MSNEAELLQRVRDVFVVTTDFQDALQQALHVLTDFFGLQTGWIWLVDVERGAFYSAAAQNLPPFLQQAVRMTGQSCRCMTDFRQGRLTCTNIHLVECSRLERAVRDHSAHQDETQSLRYHASIPLISASSQGASGGKRLGIINVAGPSWRALTDDELALLSSVAEVISAAIEREQLAEARAKVARAGERQRLSRDLHDTLAQSLTGIGLHVEGALNVLEAQPARARERLQAALDSTRQSLDELRRSMLDLRASPLESEPLPQALRTLARGMAAETGVRVVVHAAPDLSLPLRVESELYRVAEEALRNALQHAQATQVEVHLERGDHGLTLRIHDDGRGFDRRRLKRDRLGLRGMQERATLLGGRCTITSRPDQGTTIEVRI